MLRKGLRGIYFPMTRFAESAESNALAGMYKTVCKIHYASASFKASKPTGETYLRCLEALNVAADEALFVDDLDVNVTGARTAGLHGHLFAGHEELSSELRRH